MTVSNEDRKAVVAINELAAAADILSNTTCHHWLNHDIACDPCRIDALIAHGWGPTKAAVIEELQLWLESGRVREQGLVGAWEFEVRIAYLRGEDHPMMPRRKGVTDDRTE